LAEEINDMFRKGIERGKKVIEGDFRRCLSTKGYRKKKTGTQRRKMKEEGSEQERLRSNFRASRRGRETNADRVRKTPGRKKDLKR